MTPQNAADVVAWLRSHGHARMALIVETLNANYEAARRVNEQNVAACNALRAKYEPMFRYPSYKPPPEASG